MVDPHGFEERSLLIQNTQFRRTIAELRSSLGCCRGAERGGPAVYGLGMLGAGSWVPSLLRFTSLQRRA